jgi:hypothetical protein
MLRIIEMQFRNNIYWRVYKDDPSTYDLQSFQGSIINPLLFSSIASSRLDDQNKKARLIAYLPDHSVILEDSRILFVAPDPSGVLFAPSNSSEGIEVEPGPLLEHIGSFLKCLRYTSKYSQLVGLQDINWLYEIEEIPQLPTLQFPQIDENSEVGFQKYFFDTAVTWNHLADADRFLAGNKLPVYGMLLLDAISAFRESDYKRAILYSAIAVETVARTRLNEEYESLLRAGDVNGMLRFISLPQHDGGRAIKDPIYEYLDSKSEFKLLIHEQALYILKRSLFIENEPLYQNAMRLYRTRNKIVHQGELPAGNETSCFAISDAGALAAMNCAIEVFKWFDVPDEYILPKRGFVRVKGVKSE